MNEWIKWSEKIPELGQTIVVFRTPWPSFYWMGIYKGIPSEEEDMFTHWIALPPIPNYKPFREKEGEFEGIDDACDK